MPTSLSSIGYVVACGSNVQMGRIYAWRIVATMKDPHPTRYVTNVKAIRSPVRILLQTLKLKSSIAESFHRTIPEPAPIAII